MGTHTMRKWMKLVALGVFVLLSGCVTSPTSTVDSATRTRILSVVMSGRVNIVCGIGCAGDFSANRPQLQQYYMAGNWTDLAILVIRINFRSDLAYYYLGVAAEGLNSPDAAIAYYEVARAIATRRTAGFSCVNITGICDGIYLNAALEQKILSLRSVAARGQIVPLGQPQPPAPTWSPPPPPPGAQTPASAYSPPPPPPAANATPRRGPLTDDDIIGR